MIGYLYEVIRPLGLILPKMIGYAKTFKVKDGDKNQHNKLMSFCIDDDNLLEKYKKEYWRLAKYLIEYFTSLRP